MADADVAAVKQLMQRVSRAREKGKSSEEITRMAEEFLDSRPETVSAGERATLLMQVQFLSAMGAILDGSRSFGEAVGAGVVVGKPAVDAGAEGRARRRARAEMKKAEAEARAEEAKHRKKRLARGLSLKAGTGRAEAPVEIRGVGRPELRYRKRGITMKQMIEGMEAAKGSRDRVVMERMELGASRVGGLPDLPEGEEWPRFRGRKIPFVAQVNLSELPRSASALLPRDGHFLAFALVSNEKGHYPSPVRVILHRGKAAGLRRAEWPKDEEIWPDWGGVRVYEVLPASVRRSAGRVKAEGRGAKKGMDAAGDGLGWMLGDLNEAYERPGEIADALMADGTDWINLLALRSVGSMQWSDCGDLYLLIRRGALKRLDFSGVIGQACSG